MNQDLLQQRLQCLAPDDLKTLLVGGLRLSPKSVAGLEQPALVALCDQRLRRAAGSSLVNLIRQPGSFPYKQLLIDVADKLAPGFTPLSWTPYRQGDAHTEEEIEDAVLELFEARARRWWARLSQERRGEFVEELNRVLRAEGKSRGPLGQGAMPVLQQQAVEQLIQAGLVAGLSNVAATGVLGTLGVSMVGQLGWLVLVQTVGWMAGLKIALFGVGGYGAMGGAVTVLGGAAVGGLVAIPGLLVVADGPAYRKTIPTTLMLLARSRLDLKLRDAGPPGAQ